MAYKPDPEMEAIERLCNKRDQLAAENERLKVALSKLWKWSKPHEWCHCGDSECYQCNLYAEVDELATALAAAGGEQDAGL